MKSLKAATGTGRAEAGKRIVVGEEKVSPGIRKEIMRIAKILAKAGRRAEPNITEILLAISPERVLLVEVDPTAIPNSDEGAIPFYFHESPEEGISMPCGIVMVTPAEKRKRIPLPAEWGSWDDLIAI
ncbi:hypothetical protein BH09SUM1_BH09SUM1_27130 [soil metagenome]